MKLELSVCVSSMTSLCSQAPMGEWREGGREGPLQSEWLIFKGYVEIFRCCVVGEI